jgi:hypothetical protein
VSSESSFSGASCANILSSFAMISVIWYFVHGRRNFTGPPVPKDVDPVLQGAVPEDGERQFGQNGETKEVPKTG